MAARQQARRVTTPELEPFIVANVRPTGRELGAGAYGSVVEVQIPGALVAAKKLHDGLVQFGSEQQIRKWISDFVDECKLMSLLRHPHIVQFLGVCYLTGSRLPVLLMEKLETSLDSLLETHKEIPIDVKYSILVDVTRGLVYLHCRDPSIAHRDLTARNVLIDIGLTAKIADLGVARIVNLRPGQIAATMTRAPGNIIYMPPEAVEEEGTARYNTAIDIFSFGNVALFTLTQVFMNNLKPHNYRDPTTRRIVARSEIERREDYIQHMYRALSRDHPVVRLVLQCLEYDQEDRPSAVEVLQQLEEAGNTIPQNCRETKLELIRRNSGMQQELRDQYKRQLAESQAHNEAQIGVLQASVVEKQQQVDGLEELTKLQQQQLEAQRNEIEEKNAENTALRRQNQSQGAEVNELTRRFRPLDVQGSRPRPLEVDHCRGLVLRNEPVAKPMKPPPQTRIPTSITFNWRRSRDIPQNIELYGQPVVLNEKLYSRGRRGGLREPETTVFQYTPSRDVWDTLPPPGVNLFTIATLNGQLVLVGGRDVSTRKVSNKIAVWDDRSRQWTYPYPSMTTGRTYPAAVGYREYLIVAGGDNSENNIIPDVNILDTTRNTWYSAKPLPNTDYYQSVVIEDSLYLVGNDRNVLRAHIPTLISQARTPSQQSVWEVLPNAPFQFSSPIALDNMLLTVGGNTSSGFYNRNPTTSIQLYNPTNKQWTNVSDLPEALCSCNCVVFSGELLVVGGLNKSMLFSHCVHVAKLTMHY